MKLLAILMAAVLCMAVAACVGGGGSDDRSPAASAPQAPEHVRAHGNPKADSRYHRQADATPALGANQSRPIPIGQPAVYADGWTITVLSSVLDATAQILAFNPANIPPEEGRQFFMATVQVIYNGSEPSASFEAGFVLRAIGRTFTAYSISSSCGIIPGELPGTEVAPGGSLTGTVCWSVLEADAENLVMYYRPIAGDNVALLYSDLTP